MNTEKEKIREYFDYFREELPSRDVLDLFLLTINSRKSCLIMNTDDEEVEKLKQYCRELDLHYQVEEGESRISGKSVFISREEERLELLEKDDGRFCGFQDTAVGDFLGFPEEDAEYFSQNIEDGQIEPEVRRKLEEMIAEGSAEEQDKKFVEVASYVPKPEEENILRCIERGKNRIEAIEKFDETNSTDLGREILDEFLKNY